MVEIAVTKRRESVGENQIGGCEVRLDQVSKQYTQDKEQVAALDRLKEITEDLGVTVIMVTHDPMVAAYGHALITLKDGRILDSAAR